MKFGRPILVALLALGVVTLAILFLLWHAEWIPHTISRVELTDPSWPSTSWVFTVERSRVSRNWRTLFDSNLEPLKNYECQISSSQIPITSASFFFEGVEPASAKISWLEADTVLFDFGAGSGNVICKFQHGNTTIWSRAGKIKP